MDFGKSIKEAIEILRLNTQVIEKVAKDKNATTAGILILVIGGFVGGIVSKNFVSIAITPAVVLIASFIGVGIIHLLAKLFGGKAEFIELYRVLTHASILNWISILGLFSFLQWIVSGITFIWGIVINFIAIKSIYKLSLPRTVFVLLIPILFFMILMIIVLAAFVVTNPQAIAELGIQ